MNNQEEKEFYSPAEAAKILGVKVDRLAQMRLQGRIKGRVLGNTTVYTIEQIKNADTSPWKRGRKPKRKGGHEDDGAFSSSVGLRKKRLHRGKFRPVLVLAGVRG